MKGKDVVPLGVRHPVLLRFQAKVLGLAFAAILAVTGFSWHQQSSVIEHQRTVAEQTAVRAHFYRIIAGEDKATNYDVQERLGDDLHDLIGEISSRAGSLPSSLRTFDTGSSNSYSGATKALGEDPFRASSTCSDCGSLSAEFKDKLLRIKQGQVEQLISSEQVSVDASMRLTLFGMSGANEAMLIWLLGGPASLAIAHLWANSRENDYRLRHFGDLEWTLDGKCDASKLSLMALSPSFFVPYLTWRKHKRSGFEREVQAKFPTEIEQLRSVQFALDRMALEHGDSRAHMETQEVVTYLRRELESRTRSGSDANLDSHYKRLLADLSNVNVSLQTRDDSAAELEQSFPTPQSQPHPQQGTR